MSAEELTPEERALARKILSGSTMSLFADPGFEGHLIDRMTLGIGGMPLSGLQGGRGIQRFIVMEKDDATFNSTTETEAFTTKINGKSIGQAGTLEAVFLYTAVCADAGNSVTIRCKINGTTVASVGLDVEGLDSNVRAGTLKMRLTNLGVYNEQLIESEHNFNGPFSLDFGERYWVYAPQITTTDTASDLTVSYTVDWVSAGTQDFVRKFVGITLHNPALPAQQGGS